MRIIYKYNLNTACTIINDCVEKFLKVDWQDGNGPVVWAEVNPEGEKHKYYILKFHYLILDINNFHLLLQ